MTPRRIRAIERIMLDQGFITARQLAAKRQTGELLQALAAARPACRALELGTAVGFGAAHLLAGLDRRSRLVSVEIEAELLDVARRILAADRRVRFVCGDAAAFLRRAKRGFDLIFADTEVGKFSLLDLALRALNPGGIYVVDDLRPLPEWDRRHRRDVRRFIERIERAKSVHVVRVDLATGLLIAVRRPRETRAQYSGSR